MIAVLTKNKENLRNVPSIYHNFEDLFSKQKADRLPEHKPYDHAIRLQPGFQPPYKPIYSQSATELKALREYLEENLKKGFIRPSESSAGAPILFQKKKDGPL